MVGSGSLHTTLCRCCHGPFILTAVPHDLMETPNSTFKSSTCHGTPCCLGAGRLIINKVAVSVRLGCGNKLLVPGWFIKSRNLGLKLLGAGKSQIQKLAVCVSSRNCVPGCQNGTDNVPTWQKGPNAEPLLYRTSSPPGGRSPVSSDRLQAPPCNTPSLAIKFRGTPSDCSSCFNASYLYLQELPLDLELRGDFLVGASPWTAEAQRVPPLPLQAAPEHCPLVVGILLVPFQSRGSRCLVVQRSLLLIFKPAGYWHSIHPAPKKRRVQQTLYFPIPCNQPCPSTWDSKLVPPRRMMVRCRQVLSLPTLPSEVLTPAFPQSCPLMHGRRLPGRLCGLVVSTSLPDLLGLSSNPSPAPSLTGRLWSSPSTFLGLGFHEQGMRRLSHPRD